MKKEADQKDLGLALKKNRSMPYQQKLPFLRLIKTQFTIF
jgi:hypothetical protein